MTQYVEVLKKAIASLPQDTAQGRAQLYQAARGALSRQLQTNTTVPEAEKQRQLDAFEAAVATIEAGYPSEQPLETAPEPVIAPEPQPEPQPEPENEPEPETFSSSEEEDIFSEAEEPAIEEPKPVEAAEDDIFASEAVADEPSTEDEFFEQDLAVSEPEPPVEQAEIAEPEQKAVLAEDATEPKKPESFSLKPMGEEEEPAPLKTGHADDLTGIDTSVAYTPKKKPVEDFGLKLDDRARLAPQGDMDADLLAQSSLAKSGLGKIWLFLAIFLLVVGGTVAAYFGKDQIQALFEKPEPNPQELAENLAASRDPNTQNNTGLVDKVVTSTPIQITEPPVAETAPQTQAPDPIAEAITQNAPEAASEAAPVAEQPVEPTPTETPVAEAPGAEAPATQTPTTQTPEPQSPAEAERAEQVAQESIVQQTAPVLENEGPAARGAALYEESPDDPNKELAWAGTTTWEIKAETQTNGETIPAIVGRAEIPGRGMTMIMTIRKNTDTSFDASHTIDLEFETVAGENLPAVQDVGAVLLKVDEPTRGDPLAAGKAKVAEGYFLFALSASEEAKQTNETLLQERDWFDVPILFSDNRRAIVVVQKGLDGQNAFRNAFSNWNFDPNATR